MVDFQSYERGIGLYIQFAPCTVSKINLIEIHIRSLNCNLEGKQRFGQVC